MGNLGEDRRFLALTLLHSLTGGCVNLCDIKLTYLAPVF